MIDHQYSIAITRPVSNLTAKHDSTLIRHRSNDDNLSKKSKTGRRDGNHGIRLGIDGISSLKGRRPLSPISRSAREIYA